MSSDNLSCPGPAHLTENRFAALNRELIIYPGKTAKIVFNQTELQNNCACVTYDPVGARRREDLDLREK